MADEDLQLDDLGVFVRVVEHKSMSGAARRLGVPKSTVSRAIARLEDALEVRLFQRTTRSLAPTEAGQALFTSVQPHVEALRAATSMVSDEHETPRGTLRITAPNDLGTLLLADVITRFCQRYPEMHVDLVLTSHTVDLVAEGIDLAVRGGVLRDSTLVARKLAETELRLFAAPSYLGKRGTPRSVTDLASHDAVLFRSRSGRAKWTLDCRHGRTTVEVKGPVSGDDFAYLVAATVAGAGIALIPRFTAEAEVAAGRLVRVLPTHAAKLGAMYLVHASSKHVPPKVAAFRDFLVESIKGLAL